MILDFFFQLLAWGWKPDISFPGGCNFFPEGIPQKIGSDLVVNSKIPTNPGSGKRRPTSMETNGRHFPWEEDIYGKFQTGKTSGLSAPRE